MFAVPSARESSQFVLHSGPRERSGEHEAEADARCEQVPVEGSAIEGEIKVQLVRFQGITGGSPDRDMVASILQDNEFFL